MQLVFWPFFSVDVCCRDGEAEGRENSMSVKKQQDFMCEVVGEMVKIHLQTKVTAGWMSKGELFVQCDQSECQYVDVNEPPCPLTITLFEDEIRERKEKALLRREMSDY